MTANAAKTLRALVVGGAVALAAAQATVATAKAADEITVGALRFTSHSASFIAKERGYFADEGLDVEFKFFQAAQPMAVAIASGDVDFGVTAMTAGLINLADKGAVKVIGGALSEEQGVDGQKILASSKAYEDGLTSPADLEGRSFGITQAGSSFHYMAAKIAEKEGFTTADMTLKPLQKVGAIIGALKSGQIDSWAIVPHIAKLLAGGPEVKVIGEVADYIPGYQVTTVFTSTENVEDHPERVERFLAAFSDGAADFNAALVDRTTSDAEEQAIVELIHKYVYADRPLDKAAPNIRNGAMRINANARMNLTNVKDQLAWFKSEGLVEGGVSIDALVDTSFVETY